GALEELRLALVTARAHSYQGFLRSASQLLAPLFALALRENIERDFVRKVMRRREMAPPEAQTPDWPWPLAIRTLGEFVILRDGVPLESKGKAPKKPLELLKALIAHGARNVDAATLTSLLWPEADGDVAKTSFDTNLYRLRKLLDADGALALADGKLALAARGRWLQHWAIYGA